MESITRALIFIAFSESIYADEGDSKGSVSTDESSVFRVVATALLSIGIIYAIFNNRSSALPQAAQNHRIPVDPALPNINNVREGINIDLTDPEDKSLEKTLAEKVQASGRDIVTVSAIGIGALAGAGFGVLVPAAGGAAPIVGSVVEKSVTVVGKRGVDAAVEYSKERWDSFN